MRIALDSNRYTDLCRSVSGVVEAVQAATEIHIPLVVLAELRAGFAHGSQREKNERVLTRFLNEPGVSVSIPDEHTTSTYADLYVYLRKRGRPVPTNDLWIAATVVQHNLVLLDRDKHFDALPQLARLQIR